MFKLATLRQDWLGNIRGDLLSGLLVAPALIPEAIAFSIIAAFDFREVLERVTIDVSRAHIWDISSVAALDTIVLKFRREGAEVVIVGMNAASETIVDRLAIHDKPGALERPAGH